MLISLIAVFFILPDTVAAHFNSSGTVDRYGSKYEILILPAVVLGLNLLFFVFRKIVNDNYVAYSGNIKSVKGDVSGFKKNRNKLH